MGPKNPKKDVYTSKVRATIEAWMKGGLVAKVRVHSAVDGQVCPACRRTAGKEYAIDRVPNLPNPDCTHPDGCRCWVTPVVSQTLFRKKLDTMPGLANLPHKHQETKRTD